MKRETIREIVYKMRSRREFLIQTIKSRKNTIQMIVGIYNRTFDPCMLFGSELTSSYIIRNSLLGIIFIQE